MAFPRKGAAGSGKLVTVNNRFDHEVARRAIARIEQRHGWEPEAHAIYGLNAGGDISRASPRHRGERNVLVQARDFEERRGEQSAERIGIDEVAPIIRQAVSWRELHERLDAKGLRFERKGSGALVWIGEQPVKASAVGRDCSMSALRQRLGEFRARSIGRGDLLNALRSVTVARQLSAQKWGDLLRPR